MAREFRLPDLGSGLQEGQIVSWLVDVGQDVTTSDNLCEIETEKAVIEIPVPYTGTILELKAAPGDAVEVGSVIAVIGDAGEQPAAAEPDAGAAPPEITAETPTEAPPTTNPPPQGTAGRIRAMPSIFGATDLASSVATLRARAVPMTIWCRVIHSISHDAPSR